MTTNTGATSGMSKTYNENSAPQLAIVNSMIPYIHMGIDQLDISSASSPLIIADFGSSHGKNSIEAMKIIIEYLKKTNKLLTFPLIIHNDLPTNDWTTLFQLLQKDNSYQALVNGHSFYEQCFPSNFLSIGYSSSSLNWLSKVPSNIIQKQFYLFADENNHQSFKDQAKLDFNAFIEHHSRELVSGGILILSIPSLTDQIRESVGIAFDLLYTCAQLLFNPKELLDFNVPVYFRSLSECVDHVLFDQCSLQLIKAELSQIKLPLFEQYENGCLTEDQYIKALVKIMQSPLDFSVKQALEQNGRSKEEIDKLLVEFWILYEKKLRDKSHIMIANSALVSICLILRKM